VSTALLALILGTGFWLTSYLKNKDSISYAAENTSNLQKSISLQGQKEGAGLISDSLKIIDETKHLTKPSSGVLSTLGLSQQEKLENRNTQLYKDALQVELLPHVVSTLEEKLESFQYGGMTNSQLLTTLKAYLILSSSTDPAYIKYFNEHKHLITTHMNQRWGSELPQNEAQLLQSNLKSLLNDINPRPSLAKSGLGIKKNLVEAVRSHLLENDVSSIMFDQVKMEVLSESGRLEDFAVGSGSRALVRNADDVFMRRSGEPMASGINGLFTYDGFKAYEKHAQKSMESFLRDNWVLGQSLKVEKQELREELAELYFSEFELEWETYLKDFKIIKPRSLNQAGQIIKELQKRNSPLTKFLELVEKETYLSKPSEQPGGTGALERAARVAERQAIKAGGRSVSLAAEVAGSGAIGKLTSLTPSGEDDPVSITFESLRDLNDDANSDMEQLQQALEEVSARLNRLQGHLPSDSKAEVMSKLKQAMENLRDTANTLPDPVNVWILDFLNDITSLITNESNTSRDKSWNGTVYSDYANKIKGRFPISSSKSREVLLGDFAEFFGPDGTIDSYINNNLAGVIDTSGSKWRTMKGFTTISSKSLAQLQLADQIKRSFFPNGSQIPNVNFQIKVKSSTPGVEQVRLIVDGQSLNYNRGGSTPYMKMQWPKQSGLGGIKLDVLAAGQWQTIMKDDEAWSLVSFYRAGRTRSNKVGGNFDLRYTHPLTGESITFRLSTDRSDNLFSGLNDLKKFKLPSKLVD
jgi:type VI secretion system protein ImpL